MRNRRSVALVVAAAFLQGACTTALYKGPKRPSSGVAVLVAEETVIERVDAVTVNDGSSSRSLTRYEVLPGLHEVGLSLNRETSGFSYSHLERSRIIVVCVELQAGHTYRAQALVKGSQWVPQVIDEATNLSVDPDCDTPEEERPVAAVTPPAAPVAGGAAPVATETVPPADPSESSDAALPGHRPGSGVSAFVGFGFGGDELARVTNGSGGSESLNAGQGLILGIGMMATPFWWATNAGLGFGVDGALKYDSLSAANGSTSVRRFPLALTAHVLAGGARGRDYFVLKGGLIRDFGVQYTLDSSKVGLDGTWGPTAALGYYRRSNDTFAWDALLFLAITDHVAGTQKISADTFGLTVGFHLNHE